MLWAKYDVDALDDAEFVLLRRRFGRGAFEMFLRIIQFAKKASFKGEVLLASGQPCQAFHLAAVHEQWADPDEELETWERFIKLCLEIGLLSYEEGVLRVNDWKRWHIAPSDDSQQTAERQRRSRDNRKSRDVTRCHEMSRDVTECHEMSRDVTDVTSHSIAEHSKTDQIRVEQTSKQETNFENSPRPAAGQPFVELCEESYRMFHPNAGPISSNMLSKAMDFHERNRGQPSYKGLIVTESDLCAAWKKGVEGTQRALRSDNPPRVPWNYCQTIAQQEIATVVERRFEIEAISKRREKA